ncbi:hypothetical protein ACR9VJ_06005 [Streptomyces sp. H49]|uniref:hypothetical protein n=1 Tax=Streptomyces sp. H49 TaxID=3444117 RepID=UPI003F4AD44F
MPRIGCGLAGGKWSRVEPLVTERLVGRGISVTVYDHGDDTGNRAGGSARAGG